MTSRSKFVRRIFSYHFLFQIRFYSASSVNPSEISHFNALSSTWWEPYGSSHLLHLMNPLRHTFISSCLASQPDFHQISPKGLRYLDIGCGGGIFAESAARLSSTKSVVAIDPSKDLIAVAKLHSYQDPLLQESGRLEYLNKSIEELQAPRGREAQFDIVTVFEVIEHIDYPAAFLDACIPFVKPGGWLILSTIARTWTSWLTTKVVAEDLTRLVPRGTHNWKKYVNEGELRQYFQERREWVGGGGMRSQGVIYLPWLGWQLAKGGEQWGNYFFGVRRD